MSILRRKRGETDTSYIGRLRHALLLGEYAIIDARREAAGAASHVLASRIEALEKAKWENAHAASPFIRQHNAISKMVADLLKQPPGRNQAMVRFLATTLDMELPEQWLASQD